MKNKNTIKALDNDSLRGQGKLGWTEAGKLHNTTKRLVGTFEEEGKVRVKKDKITCPGCGRKFRSNNGKIPEHKAPRYSMYVMQENGNCKQKKNNYIPPQIVEKLDSYELNGIEFNVGDRIAIWPGFGSALSRSLDINKDADKLFEYTIEGIYLMNDKITYFKLEGCENNIQTYYFGTGIIKL